MNWCIANIYIKLYLITLNYFLQMVNVVINSFMIEFLKIILPFNTQY